VCNFSFFFASILLWDVGPILTTAELCFPAFKFCPLIHILSRETCFKILLLATRFVLADLLLQDQQKMAATMIGGAFLSATVQTLVEKLVSTEFLDYIKNTKLNVSLLRQLQTTMLNLQAVLDDAEEQQISNPAVKQWLDNLKDVVFDAEDLLNEVSYDSLRFKVEKTHAQNKTIRVLNFLSSPFISFQ